MRFFLSIILALILLVVIVYTLIRPTVLKPLIYRLAISGEYEPLPLADVQTDYTLYTTKNSNTKQRELIVVLIGGAFLIRSMKSYYGVANYLYTAMSDAYDVAVLQYPVRFSHTVRDAILSINETLTKIALSYRACHMIGFSAGALLAGTFIRKEVDAQLAKSLQVPQIGLRVASMTSVCGLLYTMFSNDLLNLLFQFYIMRNTPSAKSYHAQSLNVPTLVVTSRQDILYNQSMRYAQSEPCEVKIVNGKLIHMFVQLINLEEARECLDVIMKFIKKSSVK